MTAIVADALDWIEYWRDRVRCRLTNVHGKGCRGRRDHRTRSGAVAGRWV